MKFLVKQKADIHATDEIGRTAVSWSAAAGRLDSLKYLYTQGADINVKDDSGFTPLMFSVWGGNVNCVEWLVKAGADINAKDKEGRTALYLSKLVNENTENKNKAQKIISILKANGAKK